MVRKLNWQAYVTKGRNVAIEEIKKVLLEHGGYITNFNVFSDLALSLVVEVEEKNVLPLYHALSEIVDMSDTTLDHLQTDSEKEWWILMYISFAQGKGNLTVIVPEVPG